MVAITIVVPKLGRTEPEYSLRFDLPEVPRVGSYISIYRPGNGPGISADDLIVQHVWWELNYPKGSDSVSPIVGGPGEIMVECDHAIGPYLVKRHREFIEKETEAKGIKVERFQVARVVIQ